jgi:hypothetical protein
MFQKEEWLSKLISWSMVQQEMWERQLHRKCKLQKDKGKWMVGKWKRT